MDLPHEWEALNDKTYFKAQGVPSKTDELASRAAVIAWFSCTCHSMSWHVIACQYRRWLIIGNDNIPIIHIIIRLRFILDSFSTQKIQKNRVPWITNPPLFPSPRPSAHLLRQTLIQWGACPVLPGGSWSRGDGWAAPRVFGWTSLESTVCKWRFPKRGVPPNHPF